MSGAYVGTLYVATCRVNGKRYIGQTCKTLATRMSQHKHDSAFCRRNAYLQNAIRKHGFGAFEFRVEATFDNPDDLDASEILLIDFLETRNPAKGYNISEGGAEDARAGGNRAAALRAFATNCSPELAADQRRRDSERSRKRVETQGEEGRSATSRKRAENMGHERLRAVRRKQMETLGPAGRSAVARRREANKRRKHEQANAVASIFAVWRDSRVFKDSVFGIAA